MSTGDIKTVIVRAPNWLGDAVMSLPFFASLRATLPEATVICSCRPSLAPLFHCVEGIDNVIPLDESKGRSGLAAIRLNAKILREEQADCAFALPSSLGSALILWLARVPRRTGHAAEGRGMLLTDSIPYGKNGCRPHRAEGYLSLLPLVFDDPAIDRTLSFVPNSHAVEQANLKGGSPDSPMLALGPGAAQPNKMWDPQRFALIARRWLDRFGGSVVLIGSQAEQALAGTIKMVLQSKAVINCTGKGDISVAAEYLRRADVFVGNDSGLSHLAAAVGTKTVTISGPGDPNEVAPFSPLAVTVKHPLFCSPCYKNTCWRKDKPLECLTEIQTDQVWEPIVRHMNS
jgi:heptosyltransferase-2